MDFTRVYLNNVVCLSRVIDDLDWASDETLEDCLATIEALRPHEHLEAEQGQMTLMDRPDTAQTMHEIVLKMLQLLLPLLKGLSKKISQVIVISHYHLDKWF